MEESGLLSSIVRLVTLLILSHQLSFSTQREREREALSWPLSVVYIKVYFYPERIVTLLRGTSGMPSFFFAFILWWR